MYLWSVMVPNTTWQDIIPFKMETERVVKAFKNSLKAQKIEKEDVRTKLIQCLLFYHNTPTQQLAFEKKST